MIEVLNRAGIKTEAGNFIRKDGRWVSMFLATFVIYLLGGGIGAFVSFRQIRFRQGNYTVSVGRDGVTLVTLLLLPFTVAVAGYYLNHIRGFEPEWKSLYREAIDRFGKYFLTGLLVNLFTALWSLLFLIPGIVKFYAYSMTPYIIHDNPNLRPTEAIRLSCELTRGFKSELFVLYLSFFGWFFLTSLTAGLLGIYVLPYFETARAMYYENLKRRAIETGSVPPEAFGFPPPAGAYAPQNPGPYAQENGRNPGKQQADGYYRSAEDTFRTDDYPEDDEK